MNEENNSGRFKKGQSPWNKGIRKDLDINLIEKMYLVDMKSTYDIGKEFNVSEKTIYNRLKQKGIQLRKNNEHTELTKSKIRNTNIRKGIKPIERYFGEPWNKGLTEEDERVKNNIKGLKEFRKYQVLPQKDTSIELKIQSFLKQLGIEFFTHQHINIKHSYQCDILIPSLNTIIECFGTYWHKYPIGREIDTSRCNELREQGYRVFVFWENEIKVMELYDFKKLLG